MLAEGAVFASYEVRRRIAIGGMGEVYLCRHRMLDRLDAVKVLLPHLAQDPDFRRRFLREAHAAARLRHPHAVTVYTVGEADGLLYLAMEYLPGEDLATVLAGEAHLDLARTVRLLRPVADALDAAHRARLVHRDVKPRNLLLSFGGTPDEKLTLVDFGISRMLDDDVEITKTGEIVGTIAYSPPEQLSRHAVSGASDQYSLGCVAFECLTGQVPYPREGQIAMMTAHLTAPPPRASAVRPDLPGAVDAVLARAMAKDPHARYATCSHFLAALDNAITTVGQRVRTTPAPAAADTSSPAALLRAVRGGSNLIRPRGDSAALDVCVGSQADGGPVRIRLDRAPVAVRGDAEDAAGLVRWLVSQVVAYHDPRDACLVCTLAPVPGENWLWLNWLPHTRPSTPPISGPHVATTPEAAVDLVERVRSVVAARRDDPAAAWPAVVAVWDERLGIRPDDWQLGRSGVHTVHLLRPHSTVPSGVSTVDLVPADSPSDGPMLGRLSGLTAPWPVDVVDQHYVRDVADHLSD